MSDIIKTQRGFARKAQTVPQHRFTDLYFLLCKREWLEEALTHVLTNTGARTPGIDGMRWSDFVDVTKSDFANARFRARFLDRLQQALKTQTYHPQPARRVNIPKPGTDKTRPLGILTITDRVVQTVLKMLLEPIWEADFLYFSNGFRPTRCTMDCVQPLYSVLGTAYGYRWVIEGDIRACFSSINQDRLVAEIQRRVADPHVLRLITALLRSGVLSAGTFIPTDSGTSQGGPLSPLLANIYLHRFDEWFQHTYGTPDSTTEAKTYFAWNYQRKKGKDSASAQMYRYADDWSICVRGTKAQAVALKEACRVFLATELGLELSETKTRLTHVRDGFDFLGFHIRRTDRARNRRMIGVFISPTAAGQKRINAKIKQMTDRRTLSDDYLSKLRALNAVIRGWAQYYRAVNPAQAFRRLDRYVWLRLTLWL